MISCTNENQKSENITEKQHLEKFNGDWPPIIDACYYGKYNVAKELIDKGINVNNKCCVSSYRKFSSDFDVISDTTCDNWYPITYAIQGGHHKLVELLFDNGADLNVIDKDGISLLMYSVIYNFKWGVEFLLEKGVDINRQSKTGKSAIMFADTLQNSELYYLLKRIGAQKIDFHTAIKHNDLELVKEQLTENPELINKPNSEGWPPLTIACINSSNELVNYLLEKNASINQKNKFNATALMHASLRNRTEIVRLLLERGAEVNVADNILNYVIIWAIRSGNLEIVKLIVESGANLNVRDSDAKTVLEWAERYPKIKEYLIENGAK